MFQDEAGFGRINKPKRCWCKKGIRPSTPCHHIREYRYAFGAVDPINGDSFFLIMPKCDTICTNIFLENLSKQFPDDNILLVCDGAAWHKAKKLNPNLSIIQVIKSQKSKKSLDFCDFLCYNQITWHVICIWRI